MGVDPVEGDLSGRALDDLMPFRPLRVYPALLSTEADALAWARGGAPHGSLVVADYQASPRGRAGLPWTVQPGRGLGFSLILRPRVPAEDEGWLYTVATSGLADGVGEDAVVRWPDEVLVGETRVAAVGVHTELDGAWTAWAVVTVLVEDVDPPRAPRLKAFVEALERRYRDDEEAVLADYRKRCATLATDVRARLIPLGPAGPQVTGRAVDVKTDGSLVIETPRGRRIAVRPQHLGRLEAA
jgi:BirA family transcriptional regulator, biotin operon repressor / biotin---[acetyl-CoA-carboxylase] ligase